MEIIWCGEYSLLTVVYTIYLVLGDVIKMGIFAAALLICDVKIE